MRVSHFGALVALVDARNVDIKMDSGGLSRVAHLHIPKGASGKVPLVVDNHAWGSLATGEALLTDFSTLADTEGFAVVYPRGYDLANPADFPIIPLPSPGGIGYSWNAGGCCPKSSAHKRDDVLFIRDLVAHVVAQIPAETEHTMEIDTSRVYATGMSNGGFFTNRLACEARDLFAAVAPVSGVLINESSPTWGGDPFFCPQHDPPLPVLHFHGNLDVAVPWDGNPVFGFPSIPDYIKTRLRLNSIPDDDAGVVSYENGDVTCTAHGSEASNVTLCKVRGGGHSWPGSHYLCGPLPPFQCSNDIDATKQIWEFFKRYSLSSSVELV
jgi:polyhydroxybutyrate depolymerase